MCVAAELIEFEGYITSKIKTLKLRFEKVETKFKCIKTKTKKTQKNGQYVTLERKFSLRI